MPTEVTRVKEFNEGKTECLVCRRVIRLYWNGGELDRVNCCGHTYRTQHMRTDLIIERDDIVACPHAEHSKDAYGSCIAIAGHPCEDAVGKPGPG